MGAAGLAAVLAGCRLLTCLRLYSCAGPLTDALALAPPLTPRALAFRLRELHLSWSNQHQLSDRGLAALLDPAVAALRCLVLRGCSALSDGGLWPALRTQSGTLECLEVEHCGSLLALQKLGVLGQQQAGGGEGGGAGGTTAGLPPPLSAQAAVAALGACPRLRAVTVRGSVVWDRESRAQFARQCRGVQSVVLETR